MAKRAIICDIVIIRLRERLAAPASFVLTASVLVDFFLSALSLVTYKLRFILSLKKISKHSLNLVMSVILGALSANAVYANGQSDYSAGVQAYLEREYDQAQSFWLRGAKAKDAKSMFNLGLLHQRHQLSNADDGKAEKWFRLSARSGYAAAYYHLAMWLSERGGSKIEINKLLQAADNAGFAPASVKLGKTPAKPYVPASAENVSSVPTTASVANKSAPEDIASSHAQRYQREAWISSLEPSLWTIQMLAFQEQTKVREFIDDHSLHEHAAYFAEGDSSEVLYKLIYGAYESKVQAEVARQNLSGELKQHGPWLRSVASVQSVINAQ
jgi:hypothetical protein